MGVNLKIGLCLVEVGLQIRLIGIFYSLSNQSSLMSTVSVSFVSTPNFNSFNFSLITKSENNIIVISHVGYQSKSVLISEIKDTIFLNPIIIKLDEISVFQRKNRNQIILDEIKNKQVDLYFGTNLNYPWIVAKYFPFNEKFPELKILMQTIFEDSEKIFQSILAGKRHRLCKILTLPVADSGYHQTDLQ